MTERALGPFVIEGVLGAGGTATVFAARDSRDPRGPRAPALALKVLEDRALDDPMAARRLAREARAARAIEHDGVARLVAEGALPDGRPYLAFERLEGRSLGEALAAGRPLEPGLALRVTARIAGALEAAHAAGFVHRDVKPDNVWLCEAKDRVFVLDFGLALEAADAHAHALDDRTRTGAVVGTPRFMAPEQWWGRGVDARADQYGLGATLFAALTGAPPFDGADESSLMQQHLHEPPPSAGPALERAWPGGEAARALAIREELDAVIARLLAKAAPDRFATMTEARRALEALEAKLAPEARARVASTGSSTTPPRAPWAPALAIAASAAIVLVAGYAGEIRRNVGAWIHVGGAPQLATLAVFALGLAATLRGRRGLALACACACAVSGAVGTYTGWAVVEALIATRGSLVERLVIAQAGLFEADASRFVGACAGAALAAASGRDRGGARGAWRVAAAIAATLGAAGIAMAALGRPGALLAAALPAVAIAAIGPGLAAAARAGARRDALLAAGALGLAWLFALGAGLTRVEARVAAAWAPEVARGDRVAELAAAAAEARGVIGASALALAGVAAVVLAARSRARIANARSQAWPQRGALAACAIAAIAGVAADGAVRARIASVRGELRARLAPQFALFASLAPPTAEGLEPSASARVPHAAPALQVARGAVAVDATPVATAEGALELEGSVAVGAALNRALAERAAKGEDAGAGADARVDLSLVVDHAVRGDRLAPLLQIARRSGAARVEVLLARGAQPKPDASAPPDALVLVASDFVAVAIELADEGYVIPPDATFAQVAAELASRSAAGEAPVRVRARRR